VAPITSDIPEFVTFIVHRLRASDYEAYVVGGAVRDALLKRPVLDWDVATAAPALHIKRIFHDQKHFCLKHETVTLVHSGTHFDVTPFRGAENDLKSDLSRRDFTMNAMALDPDGSQVIDPFGGESDIRHGVLRAVGIPEDRFREDPLRLLRCIRLAAELGFRIESRTFDALAATSPLLSSTAPERIRDELMKILMTRKPSRSFYTMVRTGILTWFLPELLEGYLKRQNHHHRYTIFRHIVETVDQIRPDPVLRLTALLHDIAKPRTRVKEKGTWHFYGHEKESALLAGDILNRLRFSKEVTKMVTHLIQHHSIGYHPGWSDGAVRRLIRRVGTGQIRDLLEFRRADILAHGLDNENPRISGELKERVEEQIRHQAPTERRDLAVDGNVIMEITGLRPGPEVGRILRALNEKVLDHPALNNRNDLTALIKLI